MSSNADTVGLLEVRATLASTKILRDISEDTLGKISVIARWRYCEAGDILYEMGDPVHDLYVVGSGRLRFTLGCGGGGAVIVPGDVLGWAALVADLPRRIATVASLEPSRLLEIERKALLSILDDDPAAGYILMQRLAKMITENFLEQTIRLTVS